MWLDYKACLHTRVYEGVIQNSIEFFHRCRAERNSPDCSPSSDRPDCRQHSICWVYQYDDTCVCLCICSFPVLSVGVYLNMVLLSRAWSIFCSIWNSWQTLNGLYLKQYCFLFYLFNVAGTRMFSERKTFKQWFKN